MRAAGEVLTAPMCSGAVEAPVFPATACTYIWNNRLKSLFPRQFSNPADDLLLLRLVFPR
jgi:hypothetical protein